MASATLRVGNGAGFWGDNLDAPYLLARDGRLDVLTLEYLAELTLAILSHLRSKDPNAGYVTDFPELVERLAADPDGTGRPADRHQRGRAESAACVRGACAGCSRARGTADVGMGVVTGDDILGSDPGWVQDGVDLAHMETGEPIASVADRLVVPTSISGAADRRRVAIRCADRAHGPGR